MASNSIKKHRKGAVVIGGGQIFRTQLRPFSIKKFCLFHLASWYRYVRVFFVKYNTCWHPEYVLDANVLVKVHFLHIKIDVWKKKFVVEIGVEFGKPNIIQLET